MLTVVCLQTDWQADHQRLGLLGYQTGTLTVTLQTNRLQFAVPMFDASRFLSTVVAGTLDICNRPVIDSCGIHQTLVLQSDKCVPSAASVK